MVTIILVALMAVDYAMPPELDDAFSSGHYEFMIQRIDSLLGEPVGLEFQSIALLHLWRGFALVGTGDRQAARASFRVALSLDSSIQLDPRDVSPKILSAFETARSAFAPPEPDSVEPAHYLLLTDQRPGAALRSLMLPGWGQWSMQRKTKGAVFASLGALSLGGFVASTFAERSAKDAYLSARGNDISSKYDDYNRWYKINRAFGYGMMAVWAGAVADVLLGPPYNVYVQGTGESVSVGFKQPVR